MKKALFFIAFFLPLFIFAQTAGEVTYTETVKLKIEIPEEHKAMMANMPTSQSFSKILYFNENESLYKDTPETEGQGDVSMSHESEGMQFKMVMKRPENTFYTSLEKETTINAREFFGRNFLITGLQKAYAWKLTGEQKTVLGYVCQKATFKDDERSVEAWFTPRISVPSGPDSYCGLPGLILEVTVNEGDRTVVASKVDLKKLDKGAIAKPDKGKEITQEEFDKMEAEKMKEMEQEMGGKGGMRMIIRN